MRTLIALALPGIALATPLELVHQGRLLDASGDPLNETVTLDIGLFDTETSTPAEWTEQHTGIVVEDGYYAVVLGRGTPLTPALFEDDTLWIGVSVQGGLSTRQPVESVPFALRARNSEGIVALSGAPPATDCDEATEYGATRVDPTGTGTVLYVCGSAGWSWTSIGQGGGSGISGTVTTAANLPPASAHTDAVYALSSTHRLVWSDGTNWYFADGGSTDLGSSATSAASSAWAIKQNDPTATDGLYWISNAATGNVPTEVYCDMTTDGGGWQKIDFFTGGKNGSGTFDRTGYSLTSGGNYIRVTGVVNGSGDYIGDQNPLPFANEYMVKMVKITNGGNSCRGGISLRTVPWTGYSQSQNPSSSQQVYQLAVNSHVIGIFDRTANIRFWDRGTTGFGATASLGAESTDSYLGPFDWGNSGGSQYFGMCLFTDYNPVPVLDYEMFIREQ